MKPLKIHTPRPQTHLPRHEQAARRQRAATQAPILARPTRTPKPTTPTGRKTTHIDLPNLPSSLHHRTP